MNKTTTSGRTRNRGSLPRRVGARPRQFVRRERCFDVMRCDGCGKEHWTGNEGITTSDGYELCMSCQADPAWQDNYDENWVLKRPNNKVSGPEPAAGSGTVRGLVRASGGRE